jgi:hypothetical protein
MKLEAPTNSRRVTFGEDMGSECLSWLEEVAAKVRRGSAGAARRNHDNPLTDEESIWTRGGWWL